MANIITTHFGISGETMNNVQPPSWNDFDYNLLLKMAEEFTVAKYNNLEKFVEDFNKSAHIARTVGAVVFKTRSFDNIVNNPELKMLTRWYSSYAKKNKKTTKKEENTMAKNNNKTRKTFTRKPEVLADHLPEGEDPNNWLTAKQSAEMVGCSTSWIRNLAHRGEIRTLPLDIGNHVLIGYNREDVMNVRTRPYRPEREPMASPVKPSSTRSPVPIRQSTPPVVTAAPNRDTSRTEWLLRSVQDGHLSVEEALILVKSK